MDKPKLRRFIPIRKCVYNKIYWDPLGLKNNPERHTLAIGPDDPEPPNHFEEVFEKQAVDKETDIQPVSMKEMTDDLVGDQVKLNNKILDSMPEAKAELKKQPARPKIKKGRRR